MIECANKKIAQIMLEEDRINQMEIKSETWFNKKWRPAMGWTYMVVCIFDFIVAPILWSILQATYKGNVTEAWTPLTLQGAGLFHLAMGGILGVTAWKRSEEKIAGVNAESSVRKSNVEREEP